MLFIGIFFSCLYLIMIFVFVRGLNSCKKKQNIYHSGQPFISIIIPFKNEAQNLPELLNSFSKLRYPKELFEIIFVDDNSTDNGRNIILSKTSLFGKEQIRIITPTDSNPYKSKKAALHRGITEARGDIIACTDADCIVPENWLRHTALYFSENIHLVCGPVVFSERKSLLKKCISIEFLSLVLTGASNIGSANPGFCNGASLMFKKSFYFDVFKDIIGRNHHSGDDVFLLQAFTKKYGSSGIQFSLNPQLNVMTEAPQTLREFINQRIRWASKAESYRSGVLIFESLFIFLFSVFTLCSFVYFLVLNEILVFIFPFFVKLISDFVFLFYGHRLLRRKFSFSAFLITSVIYPFYIVSIGTISLFYKGIWKGKPVR